MILIVAFALGYVIMVRIMEKYFRSKILFAALNIFAYFNICFLLSSVDAARMPNGLVWREFLQRYPHFFTMAYKGIINAVVWTLLSFCVGRIAGLSKNFYRLSLAFSVLSLYLGYRWHLTFIAFPFFVLRNAFFCLEAYQGKARKVSIAEYLSYLFFLPTVFMGPLVSFSKFHENAAAPEPMEKNSLFEAFENLVIGLCKSSLLASIFYHMTFYETVVGFSTRGNLEFTIACCAYYIFLYCTFSGAIDMSRGIGLLCGFRLPKNFNDPLLSRNLQEHWNRWHMTFLGLLREVIFFPVAMSVSRVFGSQSRALTVLAPIVAIWVVFSVLGLWQGNEWNFYIFSWYHAAGLSVVYLFGLWKNAGTRKDWPIWETKVYRFCTWLVTFFYISYSYGFYAMSEDFWKYYYLQLLR